MYHQDSYLHRVNEWILINAKWVIVQLYHGNTNLNEMNDDDVSFILDQIVIELNF